jgi:hypothetical protein
MEHLMDQRMGIDDPDRLPGEACGDRNSPLLRERGRE